MSGRLLGIAFCTGLIACAPEPRETAPLELVIVEVGEPVDAELSTESDQKERRRAGGDLILPGDFPPGLPLLQPVRVVDSGESPGGRTFLVLHSSEVVATVSAWYVERLPAAGWRISGNAAALTLERGERRVELSFEPLAPGTAIRVEY